jgi:hypothetical protein
VEAIDVVVVITPGRLRGLARAGCGVIATADNNKTSRAEIGRATKIRWIINRDAFLLKNEHVNNITTYYIHKTKKASHCTRHKKAFQILSVGFEIG